MKIAITCSGTTLADPVDPRFGRAANFIVYDTEAESFELVGNQQNQQAAQGAGIQAGETVARSGATVLITGHCGPKAFRTLNAAGIRIVTGADGAVSDAIRKYQAGELQEAGEADVAGHW